MNDQPQTLNLPVQSAVIVVPNRWLKPLDGEPEYGELLVQSWPVLVVDFYREAA